MWWYRRLNLFVKLIVLEALLGTWKIRRFFSRSVKTEGVPIRRILFSLDREVRYYTNRLARSVPDLIRQIAVLDEKLIGLKGRSVNTHEERTAGEDEENEEVLEWRLAGLEVGSRQIIAYANQKVIEHHFRTLKHAVQLGGLAVAAGIATFALAPKFAISEALDVTQPTRVLVEVKSDRLGQACNNLHLDGVAVGGKWDEPLIVTLPQGSCSAQQLTVDSSDGIVIPQMSTSATTSSRAASVAPTSVGG